MSSRDYIKHVVSNTPVNSPRVGDEYFDPVGNRLYKTVPIGGTVVTNTEMLINGPGLANVNINIGRVNVSSYQASSFTSNSGALVVNGGVGVGDSLYVAGRIGFAASNSASAAYQVYNPMGSIDVTFG
jgi:hypothetical protein